MVEEITLKKRGYSEKSRANLKPFKKGEVHNPKGRPVKEQSITEALRELAPQVLEITIGGKKNTTKTAVQLMALGMYLKAIKGDASMAREIIDRLEGKVAQPVTGAGGEPIALNIVVNSQAAKGTLDSIAGKV